ncbi:hypothetical protein DFH06DRAFT_1188223 [Mycena polygramma]|nr:hypothetical protein DFH06DRAFT_1188223 [Mycena polygramma]
MSTNPATNLVPAIGSAVVPSIPPDTKGSPDAQTKSTASGDIGRSVPGTFTDESEGGRGKEGGGVAETAKDSTAQSLAEYLPSSEAELPLTPPRPPFAPVTSNLSTQAQAGSIYYSASTAALNSDNISTMVHTGGTHSPHPVRPLGESKVFDSPDSRAASATPSLRNMSLSEPQNTVAGGDFTSKVAETLLAVDAATPVLASSSLGSGALNSSSPADTPQSFIDGSGKVGTTGSAADNNVTAASLQSFIDATPNPSFSSSDASLATGAHGARALPTLSLEALDSGRVEDDTPAEFIDVNPPLLGGNDVVAPDAPTGTIAQTGPLR